ncbi:MAG: hypothetical protein VX378_05380 [Pseudomonadota bacterium]|nr:hypothetical protein [Pseudomonadota bacterium]MEE3070512.1 hypothetical protein [Pseudomonadota bacterium]
MKPLLNPAEVAARAFAMPFASPSYPRGPYRFINREYLTIKGAWSEPAALESHAYALVPVTDLPACRARRNSCQICKPRASQASERITMNKDIAILHGQQGPQL